jgi:hypothetical protein
MSELLSKSGYAAARNVTPAAVTNWIARGKLTRPALRFDGKIDVDLADKQLGITVDPVRAASAGDRTSQRQAPPDAGAGWSENDKASQQLLRARAVKASVEAERARRDLNAERGKYAIATDVAAAWARTLDAFLQRVEEGFGDLAIDLGLDREQLAGLRKFWRAQRASAAEEARQLAATLPAFVADEAA